MKISSVFTNKTRLILDDTSFIMLPQFPKRGLLGLFEALAEYTVPRVPIDRTGLDLDYR